MATQNQPGNNSELSARPTQRDTRTMLEHPLTGMLEEALRDLLERPHATVARHGARYALARLEKARVQVGVPDRREP